MTKIITWVLANGATLLGCLQAIIKALKELLTGVINLLSLFIPQAAANKIIEVVRNALNAIDEVIEKVKGYLVPKT
jgi:phage-related protein